MILRGVSAILIACSCLSSVAPAQTSPSPATIPHSYTEHTQDFSEVVFPITSIKLIPSAKLHISGKPSPKLNLDAEFGTGFCLDAACGFIGTSYHVAMSTRTHKIKGDKIFERYFATSPQDKGATWNILPNGDVLPFAMDRDLAIFELRWPLPHHHGLTFSLDELEVGQEVDIYGYPKGIVNPVRKLTRFPAAFKGPTTSSLLAFEYESDKPIRIGGASGGIVVDRKTEKIVGILNGTTETMALAVPVQTLADFVSQVQPFLAQRIFPTSNGVSPVSADLYPKFVWPPVDSSHHRPEEPDEVRLLRMKAQSLVDNMHDFVALQTFEWGSGSADREPFAKAQYEIQVMDGHQRFCDYPDRRWCLRDNPAFPSSNSYVPASEWSELPLTISREFSLKIHQAPDAVVKERRIKVFQYEAAVEDRLCAWTTIYDLLLRNIRVDHVVGCYGEVWTDEDANILRISEHFEDEREKGYKGYIAVVTYGWLKRPGEASRLIPLTMWTQAKKKNKIYWCHGQFTNYRVFGSRIKLGTPIEAKAN
jgi:hypothetical protein